MRSRKEQIQVNQPVPPSTFQLQYPRGTYVADRVKGTSYRVDPSGRPISAETPLDKHGPPDLLPRQSARGNKETTEEPRSINWVLFGSVGLIATGLALVVRNRRRHAVP